MPKFKKKPVVIEARLYDDIAVGREIVAWINENGHQASGPNYFDEEALHIETLEGRMRVSFGDWVIKGIAGEFYGCKPDIFENTYESVECVG